MTSISKRPISPIIIARQCLDTRTPQTRIPRTLSSRQGLVFIVSNFVRLVTTFSGRNVLAPNPSTICHHLGISFMSFTLVNRTKVLDLAYITTSLNQAVAAAASPLPVIATTSRTSASTTRANQPSADLEAVWPCSVALLDFSNQGRPFRAFVLAHPRAAPAELVPVGWHGCKCRSMNKEMLDPEAIGD